MIILDRNGSNNTQQLLGVLAARSGLPWPGLRRISPLDSNLHGTVDQTYRSPPAISGRKSLCSEGNLSTKKKMAYSHAARSKCHGAGAGSQALSRSAFEGQTTSCSKSFVDGGTVGAPQAESMSRTKQQCGQPLWNPDARCR